MSRFAPKHVQASLQGGGASATIRVCVSYACKLDLVTMQTGSGDHANWIW